MHSKPQEDVLQFSAIYKYYQKVKSRDMHTDLISEKLHHDEFWHRYYKRIVNKQQLLFDHIIPLFRFNLMKIYI